MTNEEAREAVRNGEIALAEYWREVLNHHFAQVFEAIDRAYTAPPWPPELERE